MRLTKSRLSLISRVLLNNGEAHNYTEFILDLVRNLCLKGDSTSEVKAFRMISNVAPRNEGFDRAYKIDRQIIYSVVGLKDGGVDVGVEVKEVCWMGCCRLGRHPEFEDAQKKL